LIFKRRGLHRYAVPLFPLYSIRLFYSPLIPRHTEDRLPSKKEPTSK